MLQHPHICSLFDIGPGYMVMELIEGESLAARIEKGPLPLEQALAFAIQLADALDRAHRAGVTHRDVKPQNIMLSRDGVKVLDFGLAKSQAKPGPSEETLTQLLTSEGTVMGTPQYMAPEQFGGKEADARSDIWAFGAVLYEMVTGRKASQGSNYQSLVGAILATDPAPLAVKPFTPVWLERLVRRCLAKDPEDRYQSMRDVVLELRKPPDGLTGRSSRNPDSGRRQNLGSATALNGQRAPAEGCARGKGRHELFRSGEGDGQGGDTGPRVWSSQALATGTAVSGGGMWPASKYTDFLGSRSRRKNGAGGRSAAPSSYRPLRSNFGARIWGAKWRGLTSGARWRHSGALPAPTKITEA